MRGADFSEIRRKDVWSIPINILREVVINALVHADYSQRGTPHRIAFFDDRIEVESPGLLLPGLTIEDMKQGVSHIRNPVIARVFKELDLIEQWGSGIPGIFREVKAANLPEPIIEEFVGRVRFTIPLIEPQLPTKEQSRKKTESPEQTTRQVPPTESPTQSTDPVIRLVNQLKNGDKSFSELLISMNLKHRQTFRKNYLHPAMEKGLIEYTIPEKPNSRLQKYRLTDKNRNLLKANQRDIKGQ